MRLKKFDLNLLVILDALLTEQNVTRAAKRVHLSQPAVSSALARLRAYFNDELLIASGRSLVPTALGQRLTTQVRHLLMDAEHTLSSSHTFDPGTDSRSFTIMAAGYVSVVLIAEAIRRCSTTAPQIHFEVSPPEFWRAEQIDRGDVDLVITPQDQVSTGHPHEHLFAERFACVMCASHPFASEPLTVEQYLACGHVVSPVQRIPLRMMHPVDQWLLKHHGQVRTVEVSVADFHAIPHFLLGTRRIATIHEQLARSYARHLPLRIQPPPLPVPALDIAMQWNAHRDADAGILWLRTLLRDTAQQLTGTLVTT